MPQASQARQECLLWQADVRRSLAAPDQGLQGRRALAKEAQGTEEQKEDVVWLTMIIEFEWLAIAGYAGFYEVSDYGHIWSVPRLNSIGHACGGRLLRPGLNGDGYLTVVLHRDSHRETMAVHRIVAAAFHGHRPEGMETRHLDENKLNCSKSNLCYGTRAENQQDRRRHGTHTYPRGIDHGRAKLTEDEVRAIRCRYGQGDISQDSLATEYNVSQKAISQIIQREHWRHI